MLQNECLPGLGVVTADSKYVIEHEDSVLEKQ